MWNHSLTPILFAAGVLEPPKNALRDFVNQAWPVFLAVCFLVTFLVLWVVYLRRPRRRHHHHRNDAPRSADAPTTLVRYRTEQNEDQGLLSLLKPKHRRRKRRFHHRNPTLAETGGLPPVRTEPPPTPCPPKQP